MQNHPQIAELHKRYLSETQPFRKVHRLIDLFESIIKTHTVLIVSEYVQYNKLSEAAKGLLAQGLRTPSLGTWQLFSRVLFEELQKDNFNWFNNHFTNEFVALDKALNVEKTNVIAFRNGYAHGATPTDAQCETDIKKFEPYLKYLLELKWLEASALEVKNGKVILTGKETEISLHPLLLHRNEKSGSPFAFFNDLKNDKIGLLNYPLSKHYREKDFWNEFHEYLPLHEWKKSGNNEFYQRIEELTETFKGRQMEREELLNFVLTKNKGYFSVLGNPGIGKSALIAQFFKDLKAKEETKDLQVIEYFIRRVSDNSTRGITLLSYLNRKTDEVFKEAKEIFADSNDIWDVQAQLFKKWHLYGEKATNPKLVILIDGIDEAAEKDLISFIPKENFNNILFIYGSRPDGHPNLTDLWTRLPVENHKKLLLGGLSKEDIRALIYEVSNKYEIEKDSLWIDLVLKKSEGNPLYLKLLCDGLSNGDLKLNDANALPKEIFGFYKGILDRYARNPNGAALLKGLYTFAAAQDYITEGHLKHINKLDEDQVHQVLSTLQEVLCENPLTENVLDYQLFHESLREYLFEVKKSAVIETGERIIGFCADWKKYQGSWEQRYALQFYAFHMSNSEKDEHKDELFKLIYNTDYQATQKKLLKTFDASSQMYRLALKQAAGKGKMDEMLEAALSLVDMKYEEANDAPQIVALVADGEIDLALKRIDSFAGSDKEGLQRKFTLYMLCLMELTLLDSKDKSFRKSAIEKLLNHLDEKIPVDHSILNWNDFFPSYLMFKMACVWAEIGLDYGVVYKRTDDWEYDWVKEMGPYNDLQFEVLVNGADTRSLSRKKSWRISAICEELTKQGRCVKALKCANKAKEKSWALLSISEELFKQSKIKESEEFLDKAIYYEFELVGNEGKSYFLRHASIELAKHGKLEQCLEIARLIGYVEEFYVALNGISKALISLGKMEDILPITRGIREIAWALSCLSTELFSKGKFEESERLLNQALYYSEESDNEIEMCFVVNNIVSELVKQGKIERAFDCINELSEEYEESIVSNISIELAKLGEFKDALKFTSKLTHDFEKTNALIEITKQLTRKEMIEEALMCIKDIPIQDKNNLMGAIVRKLTESRKYKEALDCAKEVTGDDKIGILSNIAVEMSRQNMVYQAIEFTKSIIPEHEKSVVLKLLSDELLKNGEVNTTFGILLENLYCSVKLWDKNEKEFNLMLLTGKKVKLGKFHEALECSKSINDEDYKSQAIYYIASEYIQLVEIEKAIEIVSCIDNTYLKCSVLLDITTKLLKEDNCEEVEIFLKEAYESTFYMSNEWNKLNFIGKIITKYVSIDRLNEAYEILLELYNKTVGEINSGNLISELVNYISNELIIINKSNEIFYFLNELVNKTSELPSGKDKKEIILQISIVLFKLDRKSDAMSIIQNLIESARAKSDFWEMGYICKYLSDIACVLFELGEIHKADFIFQEAIYNAREKTRDLFKSEVLLYISTKFYKVGKIKEAESLLFEALEFTKFIDKNIIDNFKNEIVDIAIEFTKIGNEKKSLETVRSITDKFKRSDALINIAVENAKKGRIEKAIEILNGVNNDTDVTNVLDWSTGEHKQFYGKKKSSALKNISIDLSKILNLSLAEQTALEIPQISERHSCWKEIAKTLKEQHGWEKALELLEEFKSDEARSFYLKGWAESITLEDMSEELIQKALPALVGDRDSIETLLQLYAIHQLFFEAPSKEHIARYNKTLNIQWALDIKAQFPEDAVLERRSDNLEEWIGDIEDEDDRAQIELWANKVNKGKMTEEEFGEKVRAL